jgi:hypothetical protein
VLTVNHQDEWSIYFERSDQGPSFTEPIRVSIYSHRTTESLQATFLPDPQGKMSEIDGKVIFERRHYTPTKDGIYLRDPRYWGISDTVKDLHAHGTLREYFTPTSPPLYRWSTLRLRELPLPAAAEDYRATLAKLYGNGLVALRVFEAENAADFQACLRWQPAFYHAVCAPEILRNPSVNAELGIISPEENVAIADLKWRGEGPFHLAATFASALYYGGAYDHLSPDYQQSWDLANRARESLWGTNYQSVFAWSCSAPWCAWFHDIAWDWTFLAVEPDTSRITCMFTTDTD